MLGIIEKCELSISRGEAFVLTEVTLLTQKEKKMENIFSLTVAIHWYSMHRKTAEPNRNSAELASFS
jgi:hypothetical protein